MNPTLRSRTNARRLIEAVRTACRLASHRPRHHASEDGGKSQPFEGGAMGVTGLEPAFAACTPTSCCPGLIGLERWPADDPGRASRSASRAQCWTPGAAGNRARRSRGGGEVGEAGYEAAPPMRFAGRKASPTGPDDGGRGARWPTASVRSDLGACMSAPAYLLLEDGTRFDGDRWVLPSIYGRGVFKHFDVGGVPGIVQRPSYSRPDIVFNLSR